VTVGTVVDIQRSLVTVEAAAVGIKPGLAGGMIGADVAVVAGSRSGAESAGLIMTGVAHGQRTG